MKDKTLALAGVFQAAELVRQAACHGTWSGYAATSSLDSLFKMALVFLNEAKRIVHPVLFRIHTQCLLRVFQCFIIPLLPYQEICQFYMGIFITWPELQRSPVVPECSSIVALVFEQFCQPGMHIVIFRIILKLYPALCDCLIRFSLFGIHHCQSSMHAGKIRSGSLYFLEVPDCLLMPSQSI